jgi:hypothetical protein
MTEPTGKSRIPEFKSPEEEVAFWDTHDTTEFENEWKEVKIKFDVPLVHVLQVELAAKVIDALSAVGQAQGLNASTLARQWLEERLEAEAGVAHIEPKRKAKTRGKQRQDTKGVTAIESTSIDRVRYDDACEELYVHFKQSGEVYVYVGVDQETFDAFMASASKGTFLNTRIKPRFSATKVS